MRRFARIHDLDQLSPSTEGLASAVVRGVPEALIAGDSGGDCRGPARLRRESAVVMVFGRVPGSGICHWNYKTPVRPRERAVVEIGLVSP